MGISENISNIIEKQRVLSKDLETMMKQLDADNPVLENERLKAEAAGLRQQLEKLHKELQTVRKENNSIKLALNEQLLNERTSILRLSKEKLHAYFGAEEKAIEDRLTQLESRGKDRAQHIRTTAEKELKSKAEELYKDIDQLEKLAALRIAESRELLLSQAFDERQKIDSQYDELGQAPISPEVMQKRMKQNSVEVKIGLSWINRIGMLLILLGVASAARYTYSNWFSDYMKGGFIFALGLVFVILGEWMSRKGKTVFSVGMNAGGTAILYYGVFSSYFFLHIMGLMPAMLLSVGLTALTIFFSLRYDSQTINGFALFGGYLPFFSYVFYFGLEGIAVYAAMAYLFILNLSLLYISTIKGWRIIKYLSFILNVPVLIFLVAESQSYVVDIAYSIFTFGLYTAIILAGALNYRLRLNVADMVLLGLNTLISCIVTYALLLDTAELRDYKGLLAVFFCVIYLWLGRLVSKKLGENRTVRQLFYFTSLLFALLFVPFQFSFEWLIMGWGIEALVMTTYGVYKRSRMIEYAGWVTLILSAYIFYGRALVFGIQELFTSSWHGHADYAVVIGAMIFLLYLYTANKRKGISEIEVFERYWLQGFKYLAIICSWVYALNEGQFLLNKVMDGSSYRGFYSLIVFAGITAAAGYIISRLKVLYDRYLKYVSTILYILASIVSLYANLSTPVLYADGTDTIRIISLAVLISYNILSFLIMKDTIYSILKDSKGNIEYYPIILGVFLLVNTTVFMTSQLRLSNINFLISFAYIVLAFAFILYGFRCKYAYIRRLGLALSIFASAKLFIFDLAYLELIWKIAAYFGFGLVMLAISYVYQKLRTLMDTSVITIEKENTPGE